MIEDKIEFTWFVSHCPGDGSYTYTIECQPFAVIFILQTGLYECNLTLKKVPIADFYIRKTELFSVEVENNGKSKNLH